MSGWLNIHAKKYLSVVAITLPIAANASVAVAQDLTAGVVLDKMSAQERGAYVAGVVEGIAYTRYLRDTSKAEDMACVYDWYWADPAIITVIDDAFARFREHTPGAVISALVQKKCGP